MSDMFLTVEKFEKRTRQLEAFRFINLQSIAPLASMEGTLGADEVYCNAPETVSGGELRIGDEFAGRDRYLWAQKSVRLPEHREGMEVYGLFDFGKTGGGHNSGFESMLYVNGRPFQGVDTNHNDVNFNSLAGEQVVLTFMLWTGLEGGGPKRALRHLVERADIGYLHKATDEFYFLAKAIYKTVKLLDDTSTDRWDLIAALDDALKYINWDEDHFYETITAALDALNTSLDKLDKRARVTVNAVGHTHIDVAWLWRLKHTREKAMRSFSTVLKLMDEFDDYIFLQTEPQLYKYIQQDCPELFERIKARVAEGRWEADGGMWLEADCNISSGESLTRQFLYGTRFIEREFGRTCEYLWLPDVFGYSWALPQILKLCGIKTFMTTKISWNQFNTMPHDLFKWRGIDGSEVLTYFITTPGIDMPLDSRYSTYNGMLSPHSVLGSWKKFRDKDISPETLISYGFGDGGGGVNRNMLKMRRAMDRLPGLPNVKTTRADDFFRRLHHYAQSTEIYVHTWDGELYLEYHRGTYTSQAFNKRMNRALEFGLAEGEWLGCLSLLNGGVYLQDALREGWEIVLRNQFHDIIPGSSIGEVYEDSRKEYARAQAALNDANAASLSNLISPEENTITLYHSGSFDREDLTFVAVDTAGEFFDADGQVCQAQRVPGGYWVKAAIPALSTAALRFVPGPQQLVQPAFAVDLEHRALDTPFYSIEWNERGNLCRLFDKPNAREVLPEGQCAGILELYEDKPLKYDNWDIDIFYSQKRETAALTAPARLVECGALRAVMRFEYAYHISRFTQDMVVYAHSRRIDFITHADWHENSRLLKVSFPADVRATKATYDIQYGHVERPTHFNTSWDYARFEVVGHKWADISQADYGVSLLNNCKYGYSVHDNVMKLTLLKSGKYPDPQADMGEHDFTYSLLPHSGGPIQNGTIEESVKLNLPVRCASGAAKGKRLIICDSVAVYIDAVKLSEDGDCLIARVHECRGGRAEATLRSDYNLKAYRVCNLLEKDMGELVEADVVPLTLRPFEIKTFKLWFH